MSENALPESNRPPIGLAIASLVLGILAVVLGLFLVGGVLGVLGILLATLHLRRSRASRRMAWSGLVLSLVGLSIAGAMTPFYIRFIKELKTTMAEMEKNAVKVDEWIGVPAPDFTVTTVDGESITLSELKGKRVVLDFWATWCGPCVKEIPHFITLRNLISPDELVIVGLSQESEATLRPFVAKKGMNYPVASAKDLPRPYSGIVSIPTTFFIDRNGVIQDAVVGYHDLGALRQSALGEDYAGEIKSPPPPKSDGEAPPESTAAP